MKYRKDIDGLRALAVIPVILLHAGFDLFSGGFVGVDVFFVVSGYLITSIILADLENETFSFHNFYKRRVWRIMPALLFVMLTCIPLAWMWLLPGQMKSFSHSFVGVLLFVSNIFFWRETGYFEDAAEEKPMLHTWSLAVEEQYYLVFPLFMFMAWRFGKNKVFWIIVVFAAVSFLFSEWGWRYKPSANFYLAPTRAWELLAGSIAAFLAQKFGVRRNEWLSQLGLAAILYAVFAYDLTTPFPSIYALVPVLGVVLLILFANEETMVAKLLSAKAMVGIGLVSYSAYLWHQPLFAFARIRLLHEPSPMLMMGLSVVSIFLAVASWRYVEQPFRREGGRLRRCISVRFLFIVLLLLSGFGVVGHFTNGFAYRITPDIKRIVENNMDIFKDNVNACWDGLEKNSTIAGGCALGRSDGSHSFALIGDSHAGAIQTSLSDIAKKKGLSGLGLSYLSCPPLSNAKPLTAEKTCSELRKSIFSMDGLRTLPSTVIVSARWANLVEREPYVNNYGVEEYGGPWIWDLGHREETNYKKVCQMKS